jgi:hypothetical protein
MRWLRTTQRSFFLLGGAVAGALCGVATIFLVASATARTTTAAGVFDVTHVPPLLTMPGETAELAYDVHCAPAGVEDPEARCSVQGTVFARAAGEPGFQAIALEPAGDGSAQLVASLPRALIGSPRFEYYAVVESPDLDARVTVPAAGATAPTVSRRLDEAIAVPLGRHAFGASLASGQRIVSARWGDGPAEVGLESRPSSGAPIGASAFDVDATGSVAVLDHARRRLLRWTSDASAPERVPLSINGTIADLATATDGSLYVLETTSRDGRPPLVRRFDVDGRELEATEIAEREAAQIRIGPEGPVVLQRPSHQWMPLMVAGRPASQAEQRRRARVGRQLRSGGEVVVLRHGNELRVALLARGALVRSWRITSATPLGEVQLAEPLGACFVVVVRVYDEGRDEFAVLVLDRRGLVSRTSLVPAEWAEGAPFGRFRLVGRSLFRLGSTPTGIFVDRHDLEVRR